MAEIIFYGAGSYARDNIKSWIKHGWNPVYFADADEEKWGGFLEDIKIVSLNQALNEYPDCKIVITVNSNFKSVYDFLVSYGVAEKRLDFIIPREFRKGCSLIGRNLQYISGNIIRPCCYAHGYVEYCENETFEQHLAVFKKKNAEILDGLRNGTHTSCDGCVELVSDWWETNPKLDCVSLATGFRGDACNARCIYCNSTELLAKSRQAKFSTLDILKGLKRVEDLPNIAIIFNNGEFTINPDREAIIKIWKDTGFWGLVLTNAIRYESGLESLLKSGRAEINCSLDSGSKATFRKIKGVDAFEKVCSNLQKYASFGQVTLKYILMKNVNDNPVDINGFVEFAEKIKAKVLISRDTTGRKNLDDMELENIKHLVSECRKRDIDFNFPLDVFNDCDVKTVEDLL